MAKKYEHDHLYQKPGESTWYVRLVVPADVRPAFGNRRTLTKTTGTSNKAEAMVARLPILALWKQQIQEARNWKSETGDEWRQQAADAGERLKASRAHAAQKIYSSSMDESSTYDLSWLEELPGIAQELVDAGRADLANRLALYAERFVEGLERRMSPEEGMSLANEFAVLISEVSAQVTAEEYELTANEHATALTIVRDPKSYKPRSPITKGMLDSWATHLETQIKTAKTRDRHKRSMQRFSDYLTKEGLPLTFDTVHSFLDSLPPAKQTRANYLWSGRSFWKWANKYQPVFRDQYGNASCPFDGHELPKVGEAAGIERQAYTKAEIERLHRKASESDIQLAHLIQFGAYTGARLEEIGRIRPEDTIFDSNGEPVGFKVPESKTDAGVRDVPLHPALVPLFKELSARAAENDGYLFPGGKNKYGNRLDYLSKRFGRLRTAEGFGKKHVFHSLRHSFTTLLHQAGVSIEVLPYITGHETGSFTLAQYSKGPSFEQKKQAVSLLSFNFSK
ncbi:MULTISPECIES: tyrosine-type recombinase/integrase [Pseudomonadaceae]|uniref:tyrosine-type recombinase/integrase n=1 Tax=Pseudomonadaceae TaxID=135621 RepID=UPI0009F372BD|nr:MULTISPECIES: tyrosine-type recombinase/integrase [Pseudomonas]